MTTEKIATNIESISAEAVTFELEDWKPSKETPLQNQAYCAEYYGAVTPQIRQAGNRLSGLTETACASLLA